MSYTKKDKKDGLNISGRLRVFPSEHKGYTFYGSSFYNTKDESRMYFNVQFTKENDPEQEKPFDILINNAFFVPEKYKNTIKLKLVVTDFDFAE